MANFYNDNPSLKHHLTHPLMRKIIELKERNYTDAVKSASENPGEISGDIVAPNAESVDHEGPHVVNGRVVYAEGTQKNLDALVKAGLMGISLPRRYNGLNFSLVPYIMAADMVSRAEETAAGLLTA